MHIGCMNARSTCISSVNISTTTMPRISEGRAILNSLETNTEDLIELAIWDGRTQSLIWKTAKELCNLHAVLSIPWYLSSRVHGCSHEEGTLDEVIYILSERSFRANFRMKRDSFWRLVGRLGCYWETVPTEDQDGRGRKPRPIYQQLAIGLYVLGAEGGGVERHRVSLNVGHGTVILYLRRTIAALQYLRSTAIEWPKQTLREQRRLQEDMIGKTFKDCIGFLDGTSIILRN